MQYLDPITNEKYVPYDIEYSIGADRLMLAVLCEAYHEDKLDDGEVRNVLKLSPCLSAYKACILPLMKKEHSEKARQIFAQLCKEFMCDFDESGSIGKRYRRQDEIGTPFCITIDENTLKDNTVTVRDRDSMEQITLKVNEVADFIKDKIKF